MKELGIIVYIRNSGLNYIRCILCSNEYFLCIYEQDHYGNMDHWDSEDAAWWDGSKGKGEDKVSSGTYIYILDLDHGKWDSILKGYVFLSR